MRKLLASLLIVLPVGSLRCNAADRCSRRAEHDLLHVLNHYSESSGKSAWGDDAKVDYDHNTATVKYDPDKASPPARVKFSEVVLQSVLTCPRCGHETTETMPSDSCLFFHECVQCKALIRPKAGDCCVFCSYGSTKCLPVQSQGECCNC